MKKTKRMGRRSFIKAACSSLDEVPSSHTFYFFHPLPLFQNFWSLLVGVRISCSIYIIYLDLYKSIKKVEFFHGVRSCFPILGPQ